MSWRVEWVKTAESELAAVWLDAPDRAAIARAANALDQRLERDPENEGESRPSGQRITFEEPLGVRFRVVTDQRLVQVLHVWRY